MSLSAEQRHLLEKYKAFRDAPPTPRQLMAGTVINLIPTLLAMVGGVAVSLVAELPFVAGCFAGAMIGGMAYMGGACQRTASLWPTEASILDWAKIDELLAGNVDMPTAP